jgi:hypothetical protein
MTVELQPIVVKAKVIADTQIVMPTLSTAIRVGGDVPLYNGEYTVTPTKETQTLETSGKRMRDNVTVEPIPNEYLVPSGVENIVSNGTYDITEKAEINVNVKQWDAEIKVILDGSATSLTGLPSGLTKIKPYAFYHPSRALPSEYVQLDSVHFGGNSVLFTDIPNTAQAIVDIEAKSDGTRSVSQVLYGFDRGANGGSYFGVMPNQTVWSLGGNLNFSTAFVRTAIQISNTATPMSVTAIIGGVAHTRSGSASTQANVMIGGVLDSSNRVTYPFVGTVYGAIKAHVGSSLAYNYIPVKRLNDGKVGYYDSVNSVFKLPTGADLTGGEEIPSVDVDSIETADLSVTEIGAYAFYNNELSSLTLRANQVVTLGESALYGTPIADGVGNIYVPSELVDAYKADPQWSAFANEISAIS